MTKEDVLKLYDAELAKLRTLEPDEPEAYILKHACMGTRTRIHEELQASVALPDRGPEHEEFTRKRAEAMEKNDLANQFDHLVRLRMKSDEVHAERQKQHFMKLWVEADKAMADAGITAEGKA